MDDWLFCQYRELGALFWRGYEIQQIAHSLYCNKYDNNKGRQMPVHYGSDTMKI
jgi:2-oxoisovalerate dehydrogenase E1 component alpha subunit